jgi:hypothetical protein
MAYGTIKVNNITFDDGGSDQTVTVSGLYNAFTNDITVTGTISGTTVTGTTSSFTSGNFTTLSGATATFTSGVIASGTATNPSLSFVGDPNTGIYSPGADQVAVATNGVERVEFGNSEVVFNDAGADVDFRVEGDTNADLFKVDAGTDTVIVGGKYNIFKGFSRRPPLHRGPLFTKPTATTLEVVAGAVLNGYLYESATAVTIGSHTNNTDMAIWQHPTTGALVSDASFTTAPAGATGGSIVGGYHYIPSGRPTAFDNGSPTAAAEILEFSIWDLTWRPECPDPRGMTCVDGRFWCDLYLCGSTSYAGTDFSAVPSSKIGLTIADNSSPALIPGFYGGNGSTAYSLNGDLQPGSWINFAEVAHSFGKRFLDWSEFSAAAFGAPEAGSRGTDPGTVIWERQSKWGLAQATGTLWSWGAGTEGNRLTTTTTYSTHTGGRGSLLAGPDGPRAVRLGGNWADGAASGSRAAIWSLTPWSGGTSISARFAAGHLVSC